MFFTELRRAFGSRGFYIALLVAFGLFAYGIYDYAFAGGFFPISDDLIESGRVDPFTFNTFDAVLWSRITLLSIAAPLLAALPFAASLALDRKSAFLHALLPRTRRVVYMSAKFFANGMVGGVTLAVPHIATFAVAYVIFPEGLMNDTLYPNQGRMNVTGSFLSVYQNDPALYVWGVIGLSFLFGVAYASIGLMVSLFTDNAYVVLAAPFLAYIVGSFALSTVGSLNDWLPTVSWSIHQILEPDWGIILVNLLLIILICAIATVAYTFTRLRNVYAD